MSAWAALVRRELRGQWTSPGAWVAAAGYLLVSGYFFFGYVRSFEDTLRSYSVYAQIYQRPEWLEQFNLNQWVAAEFYGTSLLLLLFLVPVLTMRSFVDERRQGTEELLLTAPVGPGTVVLGKFCGLALTLAVIVLSGAALNGILLLYGNPEPVPLLAGALGVLLAAWGLAALGLAVSSSTESTVGAAVGSFVVGLLLFVLDGSATLVGGAVGRFVQSLALPGHVRPFGEGRIALADLVYLVSLLALGLFAARALFAARRYR